MSEKVHNVTTLPKESRLSKKFIFTALTVTALAVAAVVVKRNADSSDSTDGNATETSQA